jgi:hypothetical protein
MCRFFADLDRMDIQLIRRKRADIQKRIERMKKPSNLVRRELTILSLTNMVKRQHIWKKLMDRISRGVGKPLPPIGSLVFLLPSSRLRF